MYLRFCFLMAQKTWQLPVKVLLQYRISTVQIKFLLCSLYYVTARAKFEEFITAYCVQATPLRRKNYRSGSDQWATLCSILSDQDLNFKSPFPKQTNLLTRSRI